MKRMLLLLLCAALLLPLAGCSVSRTGETVISETKAYLVSLGYPEESVKSIEYDHSYSNKLLGFHEWRIWVEFLQIPNVIFCLSWRDGEILFHGVRSDAPMPPDKTKEFSEKFRNGTLLGE